MSTSTFFTNVITHKFFEKNALKSPGRSATTRHMRKVVMFLPSAETKTLDSSFGGRA